VAILSVHDRAAGRHDWRPDGRRAWWSRLYALVPISLYVRTRSVRSGGNLGPVRGSIALVRRRPTSGSVPRTFRY